MAFGILPLEDGIDLEVVLVVWGGGGEGGNPTSRIKG